ncbi:putative membrane protein [Synechococcus sp. PCC 7502]|uniref:DUF389 domain-containing protein n=1 Tax=Synechococcus sp. PCC 7502 TaxID=1173263 RepID=UPI00029FFC9A|nr:DUF389 domain-containing protein [Synechococcus sp. PCC 7502]AFY73941.1 putative membrane protein [Synechococcus sp. PCC 7502]
MSKPFHHRFIDNLLFKTKLVYQNTAAKLAWHQADRPHTEQITAELLDEAKLDIPYLVLVISSCAIATFGLLSNSAGVIIGAMIIAPLMLPIRALGFGALVGDSLLFRQSAISLAIGVSIGIVLSCTLGWIAGISSFGSEILARTQPTLLDLGIAVAAGGIGGYAKVESKVSGTVAGTAIAVALMPPVCVIGLGLSQANWAFSWGASLLFLTNLLGISLACMLAFLGSGYAPFTQARKALVTALALTSIIAIPLGFGFSQLVNQARLETSLRQALLTQTETFRRLGLIRFRTNWLANPPEVNLNVYAQDPVTPRQVELLEEFVQKQMGRPFTLIFEVSYVKEVRNNSLDDENTRNNPMGNN